MQTIGSKGRLLRIRSYSTAGSFTWNLQPDIGLVVVEVVGGGGAGFDFFTNGLNGGASSFGSHCSASGGIKGSETSVGSGGSGSNGDVNLNGSGGVFGGLGGIAFIGRVGQGGPGNGSGGGGGYSKKLIKRSSLNTTETVTVGAAGAGNPVQTSGFAGLVIVYEYSL